jgi:predicted secreted protein
VKILFVAHCILNTAAKVVMYDEEKIVQEEELRRRFIHAALDAGIQLIQLPCPEFTLYGSKRWGHTFNQFDNPFFRCHCRRLLAGPLDEAAAYLSNKERFEVLGFVGIDGSPSCGVDYTCTGSWGGNLGGRDDLVAVVSDVRLEKRPGVFFDELGVMLWERGMALSSTGLFAAEPEKIMGLIKV